MNVLIIVQGMSNACETWVTIRVDEQKQPNL